MRVRVEQQILRTQTPNKLNLRMQNTDGQTGLHLSATIFIKGWSIRKFRLVYRHKMINPLVFGDMCA